LAIAQRNATDAQRREQLIDVCNVVFDAGRAGRESEAAPIDRNQSIAAGERRELRPPHVEIERPAVNEQDCRAFSGCAHAQARAPHIDQRVHEFIQRLPHNRRDAMAAPSASDRSLRYVTSGSTGPKPANVPKPQSLPAITRSRPSRSA
jgi:hypothetical protein